MARSTVPCPHCKAPVTVNVGETERCPACGGELRVHQPGEDVEEDEALKRLLSSVKIVERIDGGSDKPTRPPKPKRPWWKFWG